MDEIKVFEVKQGVFAHNERNVKKLQQRLKEHNVFLLNLMSSPGSGKTTFLVNLINRVKDRLRVGVMEADIDAIVDAETISAKTGARAVQLHTGGACHLDAQMTSEGCDAIGLEGLDLLILENVGNLVCPAEFDTGANINVEILSVPEGDDKPLKYPLMFTVANLVIISKIDALPVFDFDLDKAKTNILARNPKAEIYPVSAKTGEGMDAIADRIVKLVKDYQAN